MSGLVFRTKAFSSISGFKIPSDSTIFLEIKASDLINHREELQSYLDNTLAKIVAPGGKK